MISHREEVISRPAIIEFERPDVRFNTPTAMVSMSRDIRDVKNYIHSEHAKNLTDIPLGTVLPELSRVEACLLALPILSRLISSRRTGEIISSSHDKAISEFKILLESMTREEENKLGLYSEKTRQFEAMEGYIVEIYQKAVFGPNGDFLCTRDGQVTSNDLRFLSFQLEKLKDDMDDACATYGKVKRERKETRNALNLIQNISSQKEYVKIMVRYKQKMGLSQSEILKFVESSGTSGDDTVAFYKELQDATIQIPLESDPEEPAFTPEFQSDALQTMLNACQEKALLKSSMGDTYTLPDKLPPVYRETIQKKGPKPPPPSTPPDNDQWIEAPKTNIAIAAQRKVSEPIAILANTKEKQEEDDLMVL